MLVAGVCSFRQDSKGRALVWYKSLIDGSMAGVNWELEFHYVRSYVQRAVRLGGQPTSLTMRARRLRTLYRVAVGRERIRSLVGCVFVSFYYTAYMLISLSPPDGALRGNSVAGLARSGNRLQLTRVVRCWLGYGRWLSTFTFGIVLLNKRVFWTRASDHDCCNLTSPTSFSSCTGNTGLQFSNSFQFSSWSSQRSARVTLYFTL
jgi:hypothetical protein